MLDLLNIHPKYFESDHYGATDAYLEKQIDGVVKIGPAPDHYVSYLNSERPIRILPIDDEDVNKILAAIPSVRASILPANVYEGIDSNIRCQIGRAHV